MFANIKNVQISLTDAIENVCSNKNKYTNNPCRDHTRNRTMTFKDTVSIILGMTSLSSNNEIIEYFNFNAKKICTTSAFVQQRSKIKYDAFAFSSADVITSDPSTAINGRFSWDSFS